MAWSATAREAASGKDGGLQQTGRKKTKILRKYCKIHFKNNWILVIWLFQRKDPEQFMQVHGKRFPIHADKSIAKAAEDCNILWVSLLTVFLKKNLGENFQIIFEANIIISIFSFSIENFSFQEKMARRSRCADRQVRCSCSSRFHSYSQQSTHSAW